MAEWKGYTDETGAEYVKYADLERMAEWVSAAAPICESVTGILTRRVGNKAAVPHFCRPLDSQPLASINEIL